MPGLANSVAQDTSLDVLFMYLKHFTAVTRPDQIDLGPSPLTAQSFCLIMTQEMKVDPSTKSTYDQRTHTH